MTPDASIALGAAGVAVAACLVVGRARLQLRCGALHTATWNALTALSMEGLDPSMDDELGSRVLPALATLAGTVVAIVPLGAAPRAEALRVGSPMLRPAMRLRSAAALLAALRLRPDDIPEIHDTVSTQRARSEADVSVLLQQGTSALPTATYSRLMQRLGALPYLIVPVIRAGTVVAVLLVVDPPAGLRERVEFRQALLRLALILTPGIPADATRQPPPPAASRRRPAPSADIVLWLDSAGRVATSEALQEGWILAPSPATLGDLLREHAPLADTLLRRARREGQTGEELATLSDGTLVRLSVLALGDREDNVWGYAALLRRASEGAPSTTSAAPLLAH